MSLLLLITKSIIIIILPAVHLDLVYVYNQWRRNEFESGGTGPAQNAGKKHFWSCPL